MVNLPFRNRSEAGRRLGAELAARKFGPNAIVLGLPRGGVPVAAQVAEALNIPLDILVVRKLGVPWQPELAMGAIAAGTRVLDYRTIDALHILPEEVEEVTARETKEIELREKLYRGRVPRQNVKDRAVILVDDGLATGATMAAAVRCVRNLGPEKLIVAVPVGSTDACTLLRKEADDCLCLAPAKPLVSIGQWYIDFRPVTHEEVQEILKEK